MTTRAELAKAWERWKSHRDGCPALCGGDPCECEEEDTWDPFECALESYLAERAERGEGGGAQSAGARAGGASTPVAEVPLVGDNRWALCPACDGSGRGT